MFIKKDEKPRPQLDIATRLGKSYKFGEVGLEIEVEGNKFPKPDGFEGTHHPQPLGFGTKAWSNVHDGSLRGADNAEYLLTKPISFSEVNSALDELKEVLKNYGSVIVPSHRTSVHVHLNVGRFFLNRLTSLTALYIAFEEILTQWCGEHRVGNLFCLRAKDAPAAITRLRQFIRTDMEAKIGDFNRYAGMNACPVTSLCSLEFRALRGVLDFNVIVDWVKILRRLYELSAEFKDPRDICGHFSGAGPMPFFQHTLGPEIESIVRSGVAMTNSQIEASVFEGVRIAQDLCYCRDWSLFKEIELKPDPFGRDGRKIAKRIINDFLEATASAEFIESGSMYNIADEGSYSD